MDKEQIFNDAYGKYYKRCLVFAQSYTHDRAKAEDIVAEAMIVLWEKLSGGAENEVVATLPFLMGTVRNKILQYFRREMFKLKMHSEIEESSVRELQVRISFLKECEPQQLYAADVQDVLQESLAGMGDKTRRVFMLSRFEHKSNDDIAAELGIGVKGVEYHMTKALKRLRIDFKDFFPIVLQLLAAV